MQLDIEHGRSAVITAEKTTLNWITPDNKPLFADESPQISSPELVTGPPPLAFDLNKEQSYFDIYGSEYLPLFIDNAEFYVKEAYGKPPMVPYHHELVDLPNGEVRMKFPGVDVFARDSYKDAQNNSSHPLWLRQRAHKDEEWTIKLEEQLKNAQPGDIFVEASPTAFEVSLEERKKMMFGNHSFLRIHQLAERDGKKMLKSAAVLHYLTLEQQQHLVNFLTRQPIPENLLGFSARMQDSIGITDVHNTDEMKQLTNMINTIYLATPPEERIPPDKQFDNKELTDYTEILRPWVAGIGKLMQRRAHPNDIVDELHGWENAFKEFLQKGVSEEARRYFAALTPEQIVNHYFRVQTVDFSFPSEEQFDTFFRQGYIDQPYEASTSMCGAGSGYGQTETSNFFEGFSGSMDYVSMTNNMIGVSISSFDRETVSIRCPGCKERHIYSIKGVKEAGKLQCKGCSNSTKCWEPIVKAALLSS